MVNVKASQLGTTTRMNFSQIDEVMPMPNLIEVQKNSYKWFLDYGLKEVFRDIGEITDFTGNLILEFIDYTMDDMPKYTVRECKERNASYSVSMRVKTRLFNKETGEVKESDVYMGDFPLMTTSGTFVINGAERAIVSQLVRSPGVYYGMDHDKTGKELYTTTVIPNRGAWLEYETDQNDLFYVKIDKNRKIYITTFIRALGLSSNQDILEFFGSDERIIATLEKDTTKNAEEALLEVYRKLRPGEPPTLESAQTHISNLLFDPHRYDLSRVGRYKYNKKLGISHRLSGNTLAAAVVNLIFPDLHIDGWVGVLVSIFVIKGGLEILFDVISKLMGERPSLEQADKIMNEIMSTPGILGAYDLAIHNYGPDTFIANVNLELDENMTMDEAYRLVKPLQIRFLKEFGIFVYFGFYSVNTSDPEIAEMRQTMTDYALSFKDVLQVHAFYVDKEKKFMSFDVVYSFDADDEEEIASKIRKYAEEKYPGYECLTTPDRDFTLSRDE